MAKDDMSIIMSNFHIQLVAESEGAMRRALEIAFASNSNHVSGWGLVNVNPKAKVEDHTEAAPKLMGVPDCVHKILVFYWSEPEKGKDYNKFPVPLKAEAAAKVAMEWLVENGEYGDEPDHDGSNHKGFYLFCNTWGHVMGSHYGVVGIGPAWAEVGK